MNESDGFDSGGFSDGFSDGWGDEGSSPSDGWSDDGFGDYNDGSNDLESGERDYSVTDSSNWETDPNQSTADFYNAIKEDLTPDQRAMVYDSMGFLDQIQTSEFWTSSFLGILASLFLMNMPMNLVTMIVRLGMNSGVRGLGLDALATLTGYGSSQSIIELYKSITDSVFADKQDIDFSEPESYNDGAAQVTKAIEEIQESESYAIMRAYINNQQGDWMAGGAFYSEVNAGGDLYNSTEILDRNAFMRGEIDRSDKTHLSTLVAPYRNLPGGAVFDNYVANHTNNPGG